MLEPKNLRRNEMVGNGLDLTLNCTYKMAAMSTRMNEYMYYFGVP